MREPSSSCRTARSSICGAACCCGASRFEDGQGRRSTLKERRLVSMGDMHLGALELTLTADNWSASVTVRSAIDGRVVNAGAKLYRKFNNKHLEPLAGEVVGEDGVYLLVRTCQSNIHVAQAARTRAFLDGQPLEVSAPGHRGTGIHRAGAQSRRPARRDAGAGEAGLFLYLARSRHFGVRAGGAQGDRARGSLRSRDGGPCSCLEAPVAPLRRAYPAGRSRVQVERPDAASAEHVSPAAGRIAQLHRSRYRRARAGLDRGGVSGPCLLGRAVHLPVLQLSHARNHPHRF